MKDINMCIQKNTVVAFAGSSGSGKTTLVNMLLKFYQPDSGKILIGNSDISELSGEELRHKIGIVNQNARLFDGTIKSNLLLGNADATEEDMWRVLGIAHAAGFVRALPQGLDTTVSNVERLSTGQAQRIILARVLLRNPDIIILDEATSNIDEETERQFIEDVKEFIIDKIVIIIAYRKKSLELAQNIFFLEEGRMIDSGNAQELNERCIGFKRLTMAGGGSD